MRYGSVKRVANGYFNSNLLQLTLQFKFPNETTSQFNRSFSWKGV